MMARARHGPLCQEQSGHVGEAGQNARQDESPAHGNLADRASAELVMKARWGEGSDREFYMMKP